MLPAAELALNLATALAAGLLIGAERGWRARDTDDTHLVAGIRTFGLVGLLGGLAALLGSHFGVAAWIAIGWFARRWLKAREDAISGPLPDDD